ncbi:cilia- and flagella-associated protein 97-like [Haliotis rubra]|uniref:cilia- and flagella-associated protein 97-like n=1 Tax=Haliotis rubra TaxID=36100 RepID=UPI001EE4F508|nr:cilia- and flagella-associated protein 97-like [Haliotis rubra]
MDMDQDLEELKGDVDFDFFDSPGKDRSRSPRDKTSSEKISSKPPPAPKSPKLDSPVDIQEYEYKRTSNSRTGGPREDKVPSSNFMNQEDEEEYSSDSDHTDSESESDSSFSDVSSVRSGGRGRNRSRSSSKSRSQSTSPDQRYTRSEKTSKEHSRSDKRRTRSRSESLSDSESGSESTSDFSDRSPSPTPRNKQERKYKDISQNPVHKVEGRPREARVRPVSAHPSKKQSGSKHQAWGASDRNNSFRNSDSSRKNKSRYGNDDRSGSDSESDMTDVSPLTSPRNSPHKKRYDSNLRSDLRNGSHKKTVQYRGIPPNLENAGYSITPGEAETLDLNILMKAVSELEKTKRVKDNTRRVMFAPPKAHDSSNYTFTDDRTKLIEKENQRLLREIMKHVAEQRDPHQMKRADPTPVRRVTASAINRQRQQKRIESDNLQFLRRLQKVKPTRGMSRDDQINHYQHTMLYGVPIAAGDNLLKSGRRSRPGSAGSILSQRSRSMCSVTSASTNASAASTMRSATSTRSGRLPKSAKRFTDARPEWSDRW